MATRSSKKSPTELDRDIAEALARRKSPLRVGCRTLAFGIKSCDWKVVGDFRGAEFTSRTRSGESAIVHPSTKRIGNWQVSFFDEQGPSGDSQHASSAEALKMVSPRKWKLKTF